MFCAGLGLISAISVFDAGKKKSSEPSLSNLGFTAIDIF
jgi:hypothetical protein